MNRPHSDTHLLFGVANPQTPALTDTRVIRRDQRGQRPFWLKKEKECHSVVATLEQSGLVSFGEKA